MKNQYNSIITTEIIRKAMDYESYNALVVSRFNEGRTTNDDNSESMLNYTKLNIMRTQRIDRKGVITDETIDAIKDIEKPQIWFVLTEGWCGDSAQLLPYIYKMSELNSKIDLKIVLRDEYPDIMDAHLTNGVSRSIPKLVILDPVTFTQIAEWGPRPSIIQDKYVSEINNEYIDNKLASQNLHAFYAKDKGLLLQREFRSILSTIK